MSAAELGARLAGAGVRRGFGIVGGGASLDVAEALHDAGGTFHMVGHEAAGVLMAAGAWRSSGSPAVAVSIKGPGVANAVPGLAHCHFEQLPCLTLAEAYGTADDPGRMHKRLAHRDLLRPITKARFDIRAEPDVVLATASAEAPGPVHVDLAVVDGEEAHESAPVDGDASALLRAVAGAERPVVVAGALGTRRAWGRRLRDLRLPVFTTASAKGLLDEGAEPSAGVFTGAGGPRSPEHCLLADADLVVGLGLRGSEVLVSGFGVETVVLDEVLDEVRGPGEHIVAGADAAAWTSVLDALADRSWGLDVVAAARSSLVAALDEPRWWPGSCVAALDVLASPLTLVADTGSFCTIAEHRYLASGDRRFVGSSNGRYMGVGLPMAIGHALGDPDVPVVCLVGDGGIWSYPAEWKLAVAEALPICLLLVRDGVYSSVAQGRGATSAPITVQQPSWAAVVAGMGSRVEVVGDADALRSTLAGWDRRSPLFVESVLPPDWDTTVLAGVR